MLMTQLRPLAVSLLKLLAATKAPRAYKAVVHSGIDLVDSMPSAFDRRGHFKSQDAAHVLLADLDAFYADARALVEATPLASDDPGAG